MDTLETLRQVLCGMPQSLIPSCIKGEITLDKSAEVDTALETEMFLVISDPPVKLRA